MSDNSPPESTSIQKFMEDYDQITALQPALSVNNRISLLTAYSYSRIADALEGLECLVEENVAKENG